MVNPQKYIKSLVPTSLFGPKRTKQILSINPTIAPLREDASAVKICIYDYNQDFINELEVKSVEETFACKANGNVTWINIDGLKKEDVEKMSDHFGIHPLLAEDILSMGQRPKMDELNGILFCLLNMLYFNEECQAVEQEQISIVLGKDFVITFQEDPQKDVFNPIREKLKFSNSKLRQRDADYLLYSMLDLIVDNYFVVMEKLGEYIEVVEEQVVKNSKESCLPRINHLRKELIVLKRNIGPVRDLVSSIARSDSDLLDPQTLKYFKDIQDHITQANDLNENYRDVMISMQDLYINNVNLRMNEVMKVIAMVTCLLAPATVIGGIFGMNFDSHVNFFHQPWGFYTAVSLMLLIPIWMLWVFKQKGWF
ncbi:MAG: magnesium/cobalt transporter CorA [Candidatus Dadabacteria bacterium]